MCLGVPGKIVEVFDDDGINMGRVDFGGLQKEVCLAYTPDVVVGDYVIVHVGFAITQLDETSAQETLALLHRMAALEEELAPGDGVG